MDEKVEHTKWLKLNHLVVMRNEELLGTDFKVAIDLFVAVLNVEPMIRVKESTHRRDRLWQVLRLCRQLGHLVKDVSECITLVLTQFVDVIRSPQCHLSLAICTAKDAAELEPSGMLHEVQGKIDERCACC
jgi:hypothetical protein